jgi:hypothetical protein
VIFTQDIRISAPWVLLATQPQRSYWSNMGVSARQRGKADKLQETLSDRASEPQEGEGMLNGKPKTNGTVGKVGASIQKKENIFLFIPNIIGQSRGSVLVSSPAHHFCARLLARRPRHRLALLHASPPPNMLPPLLDILPTRCAGRHGRSTLQPIHHLWRSARHGDGSLHHLLPPSLPSLRLAKMEYSLPRTHQLGSSQSLYPHVRHINHGRPRPEP